MSTQATLLGIASRFAFVVCGIVAVLVGRVYRWLAARETAHGEWLVFSGALITVGIITVLLGMVPAAWIRKVCRFRTDSPRAALVPIKMLWGFVALGFVLSLGLYFAPRSWNPGPGLVFAVCPACVLTITVDTSLATWLLLLVPISAAVYGAVGAALGFLFLIGRAALGRQPA